MCTLSRSRLSIPSQAFLDVSSATNPALSYGATGILGLGFTSLSSIDYAVNQTGADWGRSLLLNAFIADPTTPNYITFAMQRSTEAEDEIEGTFTIGTPRIDCPPPVEVFFRSGN